MKRTTIFALSGAGVLAAVFALSSTAEPNKPAGNAPKVKKGAHESDVAAQMDKLVEAEWGKQKLDASELSDDAEFLRRATLDITGQIPTSDDARAFLLSNDPDKRHKKIDELLDSPLYAEHWAFTWAQRLLEGSKLLMFQGDRAGSYKQWFRESFASNKPYNQFVTEIVGAEGDTDSNGATAWLVSLQDAGEAGMAASAARNFLGLQIQCAQCHDSKVNDWKRPDFWGVAAFFSRTKVRRVIDPQTKMPTGTFEIIDLPRGESAIPDTNPPQVIEPKYLEGKELYRPGGKPEKTREFKNPKKPENSFIGGRRPGHHESPVQPRCLRPHDRRLQGERLRPQAPDPHHLQHEGLPALQQAEPHERQGRALLLARQARRAHSRPDVLLAHGRHRTRERPRPRHGSRPRRTDETALPRRLCLPLRQRRRRIGGCVQRDDPSGASPHEQSPDPERPESHRDLDAGQDPAEVRDRGSAAG
ncbi:MAG: DUF1549 domain-containing protein [Planctomycetes bacterium]|nr:DUF1549 domain-containing protein [Planctomycetota bacterium]